uniref:Uncharacterized protein n=1 Tax=Anguilla anguilla TaxID=7936 RepID=A0A0E9W8Y8_ANGAN
MRNRLRPLSLSKSTTALSNVNQHALLLVS